MEKRNQCEQYCTTDIQLNFQQPNFRLCYYITL